MKSFRYVVIVLLIIISAMRGYAQQEYLYQQLNNSDGLSSSYVNRIYQDKDQLIWFATWDGLNFYDGSLFHVFNYNKPGNNNTLGSNVVYQITEDKKKNIWLGTAEGVSRFNKITGKISNYFYDQSKEPGSGYFLALDSSGIIYAAPINKAAVNYYDEKTDSFKSCAVEGLAQAMIKKMAFDKGGRLWIFRNSGLDIFEKAGNQFKKIKSFGDDYLVDNLLFSNGSIFFTTGNKKLFRVNEALEAEKKLDLPFAVRSMTFYQQHFMLAWSTEGMGEYDLHFKQDPIVSNTIPQLKNFRINNLSTGADNTLWCGTDGSGIIKISLKNNFFRTIHQLSGRPLTHTPIRTFCQVDQKIWSGTKNNSIIEISNAGKPNASLAVITLPGGTPEGRNNGISALAADNNHHVYIASESTGLNIYNTRLKNFINWKDIAGTGAHPVTGTIRSLLCDKDSSLWMGLSNGSLVHLKLWCSAEGNYSLSYLQQYYPGENNPITALAADSRQRIWIACRFGGLRVLDRKTGKYRAFRAGGYPGSLSNSDVLSLYADRQHRMWIGTSYGLNYINEDNIDDSQPVFNSLNIEDGLPNSIIHGIQEDDNGYIWVSTNKGLARIDPAANGIIQFKVADGLLNDEFCDNAIWKSPEGYLFFGSVSGFNYCLPQSIHFSNLRFNLMLSELQLGGRSVNENGIMVLNTRHPGPVPGYQLSHRDNFFELKIKAINFFNNKKCQYAYFLEGNDKVWHYLGDDRRISYSNIPPGQYRLLIKWSNGEGAWNSGSAAFNIHIRPNFWLTFPAFMLYFLLLATASYLFHIYRRNRLRMKHRLDMEHVLRKKDEEQHQEQLDFFTNVAHELKTPLTLIAGSLERYFEVSARQTFPDSHLLSIVNQQSARLNYLVHQLLEFRKAETGHLKNQYSYLNISNLFSNISALFLPLAKQKQLRFTTHTDPGIRLWTDKDKLEKILFNLLSNAFKHTPDKQEVACVLRENAAGGKLELTVTNTGTSLSEADVQRLFTKFSVTDESRKGNLNTGLGLAFTRQLVLLLQGSIEVNSEPGSIDFKVSLPLHYRPEPGSILAGDGESMESPSYLLQAISLEEEKFGNGQNDAGNKLALLGEVEKTDKKKILVIEDEPTIRYLITETLQDRYTVFEAGNGANALALLNNITPNLIICDIMMPDMSGLAICHLLKKTPATCHIPFVILSAKGTPEQQIEGYEAGAEAYITKPFNMQHLLVRVRKLLEYQEKLHALFKDDRITTHLSNTGLKEEDQAFLEKTISLIETNIENETLDAAFLEKQLGMSKAYFYRRIKALSDMTPGELIKHIRLQQASALLKTSELTVAEIFYKSGFNNQSHFFREFKKKYHTSPSEFRAQFRIKVPE